MIATLAVLLVAADTSIYLGIVETSANPAVCAQSEHAIMRIAFQFANGQWAPAESDRIPAKVSWVLALDGKRIGQVVSESFGQFSGASCEIGTQRIITPAVVPQIAKNAKAFWTWPGYPPFRPLAAVSAPNYADPDQWKPFHPTQQQFQSLHPTFRREVAMPVTCESEPIHTYPSSYFRPIAKGYRSKGGKMLIGFIADARLNACVDWPSPAWFLVDGASTRLIGTDITLLDAGDYDGDGSSELLFHMSEYNHDGYLLFRPSHGTKAQFSWHYH